ncbi:interferon gamma receptor 1 [Hypomesus transpacificus]|uniref:interferon gamma receptor 1 n=1 Tax=Hypomesus transpacificus TaxID=137520 RepID=UPI001F07861C|nr:interferon gamma receptor 1 [Hypomesus transpacificus]
MVLATSVFILILMIIVEYVSSLVLPPENVTVSCHNFQTRAYWNYSKHPLPPNFILHFVSESENKTVTTTELHYDLTHLMRASSFSNRYAVEVRAVEGAETSQHVSSPIITFNILKMADVKCALDFPPVKLSPDDMGIAVSFRNPFYYYKELAESNPFDRVFHYKVFTENTSDTMSSPTTHKCTMARNCGVVLPSSRGPYCVQLNGSIMDGKIPFKKTAIVCTQDHHAHESYVFILLGVVLAVFIIVSLVIIVMVYQVKAWKTNPSILPKALASLMTNPNERRIMQFPEDRVEHIAIEDYQAQTEEVEIIEVERPCCMVEDQNAQFGRLLEEDEEEDECPPSGYGHAHSLDM